jgi:glutathione S-transferase
MTFSHFNEVEPSLPSGVLPILDIVDCSSTSNSKPVVVDQSIAILRYIGKLNGTLYPTDDSLRALQVDRMIDLAEDANTLISMTLVPIRGPVALCLVEEGSPSWTAEEVVAIRKRMMDPQAGRKNVAFFLQKIEDQLKASTSGYLVGDTVTIADLRVHQLVEWFASGVLDGVDAAEFVRSYPELIALKDKVEALPLVRSFRNKYGYTYDFEYTP